MPILQSNQNIIPLKTSASLLVEFIYFAINTILFIRGFSMLSNFTLQFHYDTPIWILTDDNLSHSFKQQLKSLREMLVNRFVRKIFLYLRDSTTNEIMERWDFVVECEQHNSAVLKKNDLLAVQNEIKDVLQQICSMANYLPVLTREWQYTITVKLEEPLMANVDALKIPRSWLKNKNTREIQNMQKICSNTISNNIFKTKTIVNYKK